MLPIEQEMAIHLAALDLSRDIADRFAKLRAKLLPEQQQVQSQEDLFRNVWSDVMWRHQQAAQMQARMIQPGYLQNPLQAANQAWPMSSQLGVWAGWPF